MKIIELILISLILCTLAQASTQELPTVKASVLMDGDTINYYGGRELARKEAENYINRVAAIYRRELHIDLVMSYFDSDSKALRMEQDANMQIESLQWYRKSYRDHAWSDVTLYLTIRQFAIGNVTSYGFASIGPLCSEDSAAVVSLQNDGLDVQVIAHEIAHTMGAPHDEEGYCKGERSSKFIMAPRGRGHQYFSNCSKEILQYQVKMWGSCVKEAALQ